jgi:glycosyltransferase involved in cell wall biosynthesis
MPTRVLLILENKPSPMGGVERHCHNILNLFRDDSDISAHSLSRANVKHRIVRAIDKIFFDPDDFASKFMAISPDVVHVHGFASLVVRQALDLACRTNVRIVYSPHYHPFHALDNPFLGKCFFHAFMAAKLKKADAVLTINRDDTLFFGKYSNRVYMMPHWLDDGISVGSTVRDEKMVLFVGRVEANKGVEHLYSLPRNRYDVHCVSSGNFDRDDFAVHRNVTEAELYALYARASVVAVPSRYEAFSYVALEALLSGAPVVVSDRVRIVDYLGEIIGRGIEVFKFGDYSMFGAAIEKARKQKVDPIAIASIFDRERMKAALKSVYENKMD